MVKFKRVLRRICSLIPLALLATAVFYFVQPIPLPVLPENTTQIDLSHSQLRPYDIQHNQYVIEAGSSEWSKIQAVLNCYAYHRCWETLFGGTHISSVGNHVLSFYARDAGGDILWDVTITSSRHLRVGDTVYHLGWWGDGLGQKLANELACIIETDPPKSF